MEPHGIKDLFDIYMGLRSSINSYWLFYFVVTSTIVGWFVGKKPKLSMPVKIMISLGYIMFVTVSFTALSRTYKHLVAVKSDLKVICTKTKTALCANICDFSNYNYDLMIWGIILGVVAGVLIIIWIPSQNLKTKKDVDLA